jgi:hypothetical protein
MADKTQHDAKLNELQAAVEKAEEAWRVVRERGKCHADQVDAYQKVKETRAALEEYNKMRAGKSHEEKPIVAAGSADNTQTKNQQESSCADDVNKQEHADTAASPIWTKRAHLVKNT